MSTSFVITDIQNERKSTYSAVGKGQDGYQDLNVDFYYLGTNKKLWTSQSQWRRLEAGGQPKQAFTCTLMGNPKAKAFLSSLVNGCPDELIGALLFTTTFVFVSDFRFRSRFDNPGTDEVSVSAATAPGWAAAPTPRLIAICWACCRWWPKTTIVHKCDSR